MKITWAKTLTFICGTICLISTGRTEPLRATDYRDNGRYYADRRVDYRHARREVLPPRIRIQGTTRHDRELARLYAQELYAEGPMDPHGPPIDISISYGRITLRGRIEPHGEHAQLVDAARRLRGAGVVDFRDELRT